MNGERNVGAGIDLALDDQGSTLSDLPESLRASTDEARLTGGAGTGGGPPPATAAAGVEAAVAAERTRLEAQFKADTERRQLRHEIDMTDQMLSSGMSAFAADTVKNLKFKAQVNELRLDLRGGGYGQEHEGKRKDREWYKGRLDALVNARGQEVLDEGTDGADHLPTMSDRAGDVWDPSRMLSAVRDHILKNPSHTELEQLTGAPELDFIQQVAKSEFAQARLAEVRAAHKDKPRALHIPVPALAIELAAEKARLQRLMAVTGWSEARLAQSYATDRDDAREPTYRRDMLVPFFRNIANAEWLGFPMPMIANDVTLPAITASLSAAHYAENADIAAGTIDVSTHTTEPHRYGAGDPISWTLLAAGDAQFGIQPVVLQEIAAAVADLKEQDIYIGDGSANTPRGIWSTSGMNALTVNTAGSDPTFKQLLSGFEEIAKDKIPVENCKFIINPTFMVLASTVLTFGGSSSFSARPLFEAMAPSGPSAGFEPTLRGFLVGFACAVSTHLPTDADPSNRNLSGSDGSPVLFGDPRWVPCFDYSMGVLTVDDLTSAQKGQTEIWYNGWNDVYNRLPSAWATGIYDPSA